MRLAYTPPKLPTIPPPPLLPLRPPRPSDLPMSLTFSAEASPVPLADLSQLQRRDTTTCSPVLEILIPGFPR